MSKAPEVRIKVSNIDRLLLLTEAQLKVWLWYKRREGKDKRAYGKAKTIADATKLEPGTIRNARSWLTRNGWLLRRLEPGKLIPLFLAVIPELHLEDQEVSSSNDSSVIPELQGVSFEDEPQVVSLQAASMKDSALTSGLTNKETKPLLASLVAHGVQDKETPAELFSEKGSELSDIRPTCFQVQELWQERTGYRFSTNELLAADRLVRQYGTRVVIAVLRNTLFERPETAKWSWNNFKVFADNYTLNHEKYLAYCSSIHLTPQGKKSGITTARTPVKKFDDISSDYLLKNPEKLRELAEWFNKNNKVGEWSVKRSDHGVSAEDAYAAMSYIADEGIRVTKSEFVHLLLEASGMAMTGEEAKAAAASEIE